MPGLYSAGGNTNFPSLSTDTPLRQAVSRGDIEQVRTLLDQGSEINAPSSNGNTPIDVAVHKGHIDIVRILLDRSADVNLGDRDGDTPIHTAAYVVSHPDILTALLAVRSANVNAANRDGWTPLHWVSHYAQQNYHEALRNLLALPDFSDAHTINIEDEKYSPQLRSAFRHAKKSPSQRKK